MRELKVGASCKVYGEGADRFIIKEIYNDGKFVGLTKGKYDHGSEGIDKIYSIRYPPRLKSYYESNLKGNRL